MKRILQLLVLAGSLICLGAVPEPPSVYPSTEPSQTLSGGAYATTQQASSGLLMPPKIRPVFDAGSITGTPYNARFMFQGSPYPGAMPMRTEPGGRFNRNYPNLPIQEDSYFVGGWFGPRLEIDEAKLRLFARQLLPNSLFVLDIENLDCYWDGTQNDNRVVENNVRQMIKQIRIIREEAPTVQLGVYGMLPAEQHFLSVEFEYALQAHNTTQPTFDGVSAAYWRSIYPTRLLQFGNWQRATDRMTYGYRDNGTINWNGGLVDAVNYLAPSIYMVDDVPTDDNIGNAYDIAHDKAVAKWSMREAKRIAGGKPIYPFVWRYLLSGPSANNPQGIIPLARFDAFIKELADNGADGVIIWGPMSSAAIQNETMDVLFKYFDRVYPNNVTPTTRP